MSKKNKIVRFAFGTAQEPKTAVWRVSIENQGDVYLNSEKSMANYIHIALHKSGQCSYKLRDTRFPIDSPWKDPLGYYRGPMISCFNGKRNLPAPKPTGSVDLITWLGTPDIDHVLTVTCLYIPVGSTLMLYEYEGVLYGPSKAILHHKEFDFYLIKGHRVLSVEEMKHSVNAIPEILDYEEDTFPTHGELVRVSQKSNGAPVNPTTIIHANFFARPVPKKPN